MNFPEFPYKIKMWFKIRQLGISYFNINIAVWLVEQETWLFIHCRI